MSVVLHEYAKPSLHGCSITRLAKVNYSGTHILGMYVTGARAHLCINLLI